MLNLLGIFQVRTSHTRTHICIFSFYSYSFIILYFTPREGHKEILCNYVGHCLVICLRVNPASPCKYIYIYNAENDDERKRYTNTNIYMYIIHIYYKNANPTDIITDVL